MAFNIVLIEPEIPNNTGNIGRLALATNSVLHLVKPYGFEITNTRLKRAGLDYWQHLNVIEYDSVNDFFTQNKNADIVFFSSHGKESYWNVDFKPNQFLVFGKESVGLPKKLIENVPNRVFKIPIFSQHVRSLNLANAVSIVVYEGLRSIN